MSHVLPNISRGQFFEPIFTSKKFDLYTSIYGRLYISSSKIFATVIHSIMVKSSFKLQSDAIMANYTLATTALGSINGEVPQSIHATPYRKKIVLYAEGCFIM